MNSEQHAQGDSSLMIIFSAPSGAGKTTVLRHAMDRLHYLSFSISATTRAPRGREVDGRDYHFLTVEDFQAKIKAGAFVEWEEVYSGTYYGTLHSELARIRAAGQVAVFEVDVQGGLNLKRQFGEKALTLYVKPPSLAVLKARLEARGTESPESLSKRLGKAEQELAIAGQYDHVVVNDELARCVEEVVGLIEAFVARHTEVKS